MMYAIIFLYFGVIERAMKNSAIAVIAVEQTMYIFKIRAFGAGK